MSKQRKPPDHERDQAWGKTLKTVGKRVRHFRTHHPVSPVSQADLGAAAGTDKTAIGRLERGQVAPSMERLHRVAHYLRVPLHRLFLDDKEDARNEVVNEFARLAEGVEPEKAQALLEIVRSLAKLEGIDTRGRAPTDQPAVSTDPPAQRIRSKLGGAGPFATVDDMRAWMRGGCLVDEPDDIDDGGDK